MPTCIAAMRAQLDALAYAHTSFFTTEAAERLADRLIEDAPPGLSHVYLVSGGSEAIEAALKMARQYFVEIGQPQRAHVIARRQSYHGNTLGALAVGGSAARRTQFEPLLIEPITSTPATPIGSSGKARAMRIMRPAPRRRWRIRSLRSAAIA